MYSFTLAVPQARAASAQWVLELEPHAVADTLDMAHAMCRAANNSTVENKQTEWHMAKAEELEQLRASHKAQLDESRQKEELLRADLELANEKIQLQKSRVRGLEDEYHSTYATMLQDMKDAHQERLGEVRQQHAREREELLHRMEDAKYSSHAENAHLAELLEVERQRNDRLIHQFEPLIKENRSALEAFSQAKRNGTLGEEVISTVFDRLDLPGFLEDTRHDTTPGCEDYLWTARVDGLELRCSVESKWVKRIHSQHDMAKHHERITEAARMGKINCAIFFSLLTPIPNHAPIDLKYVAQVPVLYVCGRDDVPPHTVVEVGFRTLRAVWSSIHKEEKDDDATEADSSAACKKAGIVFEELLSQLSTFDREIDQLRKNANLIMRSVKAMEFLRTKMVGHIHNVQIDAPQLVVEQPLPDDLILSAMIEYKNKHRVWPKTSEHLNVGHVREFDDKLKQAKRQKT